jgi:hypothetical protein
MCCLISPVEQTFRENDLTAYGPSAHFWRMKSLVLALLCLAPWFVRAQDAQSGTSPDRPATTPTQPRDLFNGRDFSGWTFYMRSNSAPEKTWSITNGVIHCTGRPAGFLRTQQSFSNYRVTVEWRFVKIAKHADNTGVLVHMQLPDKVWSRCVECQGQYQKQGDFWLHSGSSADGFPPATGKNPTHAPMAGPPNEKPVGEWNTYQVIADGHSVEIIVNGQSMNKITGCNLSSGFIGIQSEGAEIEVRKILLEPLAHS